MTSDYTLLRRAPSSYVIGTAYRRWTVDVQGASSGAYSWGRVFGDLNSCLWTYAGALSGSAATTQSCSAAQSLSTGVFTNGQISSGVGRYKLDPGCRRRLRHLQRGANHRLRQRASVAGRHPSDVALPTYLPFGWTVKWRYVTRDGRYVMVRSPLGGATDGVGVQSWFFLPRGCLPAILP